MKALTVLFALALMICCAQALDIATADGMQYRNCKDFASVGEELRFIHDGGLARVPLLSLAPDLQVRFFRPEVVASAKERIRLAAEKRAAEEAAIVARAREMEAKRIAVVKQAEEAARAKEAADNAARAALSEVGRLGETPEQCRLRYGETKHDYVNQQGSHVASTFEKNGYEIEVGFFEGRAEKISYRKTETDFLTRAEIDRGEIDALLAKVCAGKWKTGRLDGPDWISALGDEATYSSFIEHKLEIKSAVLVKREAEQRRRQQEEKQAAERARLKGL